MPQTASFIARPLVIALLAVAAALPLTAVAKGTLVYCSEGSPEGFQPQFFTTGTTFDAVSVPMFNRLVEFETGTTNIMPALAESWTVAPDGKAVHVQAAARASSSTATPTSSRRATSTPTTCCSRGTAWPTTNHPFHKMTAGQTSAYFEDMGMKNIVDKVEKLDPYTVRFTLKRPEAPFLADMAMDFASILSPEYFETMMKKGTPNAADVYPIGTGPFEFGRYQKDATIRYKAFDQYWHGRPKIDKLVFSITTDATARYAKLKTGECQVDGVSEARRPRRDEEGSAAQRAAEGGPEHRLHRVQRREEALRQQARAPGAQHARRTRTRS